MFAGLACLEAIQRVAAAAGMGVDEAERRRLGLQRLDQRQQHGVFEDVGKVAGVIGVAIVHGGHGKVSDKALTIARRGMARIAAWPGAALWLTG